MNRNRQVLQHLAGRISEADAAKLLTGIVVQTINGNVTLPNDDISTGMMDKVLEVPDKGDDAWKHSAVADKLRSDLHGQEMISKSHEDHIQMLEKSTAEAVKASGEKDVEIQKLVKDNSDLRATIDKLNTVQEELQAAILQGSEEIQKLTDINAELNRGSEAKAVVENSLPDIKVAGTFEHK